MLFTGSSYFFLVEETQEEKTCVINYILASTCGNSTAHCRRRNRVILDYTLHEIACMGGGFKIKGSPFKPPPPPRLPMFLNASVNIFKWWYEPPSCMRLIHENSNLGSTHIQS